ncbi:GPW/gp25 family protein [Solirubrobacter soli]|uniref:GPW/gp25 family protein n=1 Tax=Solirubrobacter soli TaxID=363832 RepID=UPI0004270589|nr:GPW/gp25 family protein [Solirubrobacter soli]
MAPFDRREYLGTGWRFPIRPDATGSLAWSAGEQKVAESIWLVLSTALGERVMRPLVGCGVHELLFRGDSNATRAAAAHAAHEALTDWEPRIDVLDVRVEDGGGSGTLLAISVDYRIVENNTVHNLVYPLYATEGLTAESA